MKTNRLIQVVSAALFLSMGITMGAMAFKPDKPLVQLGNEVFLQDHLDWVKGKRVGLITNPSGVDSQLVSVIDIFMNHPQINLVALFGPEHGVRGDIVGGESILNSTDERTGLPVYSLYGSSRKPSEEVLKEIDVLLFDLQDIGSRSYTYISTMGAAMEACAEQGKEFIVLDRPNPLGGNLVEGNILDPEFKSFIGYYPIPYIHGMTIGELAQLFNEHFKIGCNLKVVKMKGWKREMFYPETGLSWIITSPHVPEGDTTLFYNITGIFGELNGVNIGVGYTAPFKLVGAPWIDAQQLTDHLNGLNLPGVKFTPAYYKPFYYHFAGENCQGIRIHLMDSRAIRPCLVGFHIMTALRDLYPDKFNFEIPENQRRIGMFDKACGTDRVRKDFTAGLSAEQIYKNWQSNLEPFLEIRKKYLIY